MKSFSKIKIWCTNKLKEIWFLTKIGSFTLTLIYSCLQFSMIKSTMTAITLNFTQGLASSLTNQRNKTNPMDIKPTSSKGTRLKSIYYLQVEAVLAASCTCCSDLPLVKQPILIYPWFPNQNPIGKPVTFQPTNGRACFLFNIQ